jgi:hypothetical protein
MSIPVAPGNRRAYDVLVSPSSPWLLWNPSWPKVAALAAVGVTSGWPMLSKLVTKGPTMMLASVLVADSTKPPTLALNL